jgi:hypothetical protein
MLTLLLIAAEITLPDWSLQWFHTIIATAHIPFLRWQSIYSAPSGHLALNRTRRRLPMDGVDFPDGGRDV